MAKHGEPERFVEEYDLPWKGNDRRMSDAEIRAHLRATLRGSDVPCGPSRR